MQQEKLAIGKIETCEVLKADSKSGLLVKLPDGSKGHVHVSFGIIKDFSSSIFASESKKSLLMKLGN